MAKRPPAAPAAPTSVVRIKVTATRTGYYDNKRYREGDVFVVRSEAAFSDVWMARVAPATPERITTGQAEIDAKHHATPDPGSLDDSGVI